MLERLFLPETAKIVWIGYKVHLSECCDDDLPHLITQVETVPAIEQDHHALVPIQADLAAKGLLPVQQLVDAGYSYSCN